MHKKVVIAGLVGGLVGALLIGSVVIVMSEQDDATPIVIDSTITNILPGSGTVPTLVVGEGDTLNLSDRGLREVPKDIFSRTDLERLDLSHNNLTGALPAEVRHLAKLRVLDLSYNDFTGVPAEVGQLRELQVLDLSHNRLTGLPYELGNLINLEVLDLRGNAYSVQDLEIIKRTLPANTRILVD